MRRIIFIYVCCCIGCLNASFPLTAQITGNLRFDEQQLAEAFPLFTQAGSANFCVDSNDAVVVTKAMQAFVRDVLLVSGQAMNTYRNRIPPANNIIAGTIGQSKLIDELIRSKQLDVTTIQQGWERFKIAVILVAGKAQLVITGSDRRGTAFGIFHLSRLMGVSPFVWWADVTPRQKKQLFIKGSYVSPEPSVHYRGIFINDEDWGLQPWAAKKMDTVIKDIGPHTYAKVFELMLRLKANYIWPAMHPCTRAFYYYKENPRVADDYAIVVGGSHCEPMLRNNVCEWSETYEEEYGKKPGEWRYDINRDEIYQYWNDRVKESVNYESVYTVGMRGVHDGSMPGPKDPDEKRKLLENVILDQRKMLQYNFQKPVDKIPQIFVPYKEVLSLYRRGLPLADDITIIWPDDNHGYIRQLPNETERKRTGGNGVYYHLSYWGAPQDFLWLSSIGPSLIASEMNKAFRYEAKKLWVFNAGDIKPAELSLQFALDMAWDISKGTAENAFQYTRDWAAEIFGEKRAVQVAEIMHEYFRLAASGKPEHMNSVPFSFHQLDERLFSYRSLLQKTNALAVSIPPPLQDAYFELVQYPVTGACLMNEKIINAKKSFQNFPGNKTVNNVFSDMAKTAFDSIALITFIYNKQIAAGKWDGMMDWKPRNQAVFNMPLTYTAAGAMARDSLTEIYSGVPEPDLVIEAASFDRKKENAKTKISKIEGLGISLYAVTAVSPNPVLINSFDSVFIEFDIPPVNTGTYAVLVKCLPVYDVDQSKNISYRIRINNETPQRINVYAETNSKAWRENVIRGYAVGTTIHRLQGQHDKLRIYFNDHHLIISRIEFYRQ